ncbi:MAG: DNA replication/repair protein RecF [Brevinematia bacterium]
MEVKSISLVNFRLFDNISFDFEDKNVILGKNGSGKTSVIEAINYCSTFSPLRTYETDMDLVKVGKSYFNISLDFDDVNGLKNNIFVGYEITGGKAKKKVKFNGKTISPSSVFGKLKVIPFLIEDFELVVGSPLWRRKVVNEFLILVDSSYYHNLINYHKIIKQKNASIRMIKEIEEQKPANMKDLILQIKELIMTYNANISKFAFEVTKYRANLFKYIRETMLSELDLNLDIRYKSSMYEIMKTSEDPITDFTNLLNKEIDKEILYGKSIIGPHLDDFIITSEGGKLAKSFLSQGQIRLVSIMFKLSMANYLYKETKVLPVLLIDDVLGELDEGNKIKIFDRVFSKPYQIVLSFYEIPDYINKSDFNIIELG